MRARFNVYARQADEKSTGEIWDLWYAGLLIDDEAALAWLLVASSRGGNPARLNWLRRANEAGGLLP